MRGHRRGRFQSEGKILEVLFRDWNANRREPNPAACSSSKTRKNEYEDEDDDEDDDEDEDEDEDENLRGVLLRRVRVSCYAPVGYVAD
jgi:hypothetical protein